MDLTPFPCITGPSKVLAVIDDLEDSSEETKNRILSSQPTLREKTGRNVFLFTKEEKRNKQRLREKVQPIIDLIQRGTFTAPKHIDEPENIPKPKQGTKNPKKYSFAND